MNHEKPMMSRLRLTPLSELKVSKHQIPAWRLIPNTSLQQKPLLIYHGAFPGKTSPSIVEQHLKSIGVVTPQWRYTMYRAAHFHSTSHEVLCVYSGRARLYFGGGGNDERNPQGLETYAEAGDVIVIPAGVAHHLVEEDHDSDEPFSMVGSYPVGSTWDMQYGLDSEAGSEQRIASCAWFSHDPIYGEYGPITDSAL